MINGLDEQLTAGRDTVSAILTALFGCAFCPLNTKRVPTRAERVSVEAASARVESLFSRSIDVRV